MLQQSNPPTEETKGNTEEAKGSIEETKGSIEETKGSAEGTKGSAEGTEDLLGEGVDENGYETIAIDKDRMINKVIIN